MCTHIQFQNDRNPNKFSFFSRQKILEIKSNGKMEIALLLLITALSLYIYMRFNSVVVDDDTSFFLHLQPWLEIYFP